MIVHIMLTLMEEVSMYTNEKIIIKMQDTSNVAADATRLKILFCLLDELSSNYSSDHLIEKCVNDIASQIGSSQSLVSHQLKVLKDSGFVKSNKVGTKIYYSLKDEHVRQIMHITYEHVLEDEENE